MRSLHAASGVDGQGLSKSLLEAYLEYNASKAQQGCVPATGELVNWIHQPCFLQNDCYSNTKSFTSDHIHDQFVAQIDE